MSADKRRKALHDLSESALQGLWNQEWIQVLTASRDLLSAALDELEALRAQRDEVVGAQRDESLGYFSPIGHARCTNCSKVYRLFLTKSRTCEHCGHNPVEVVPVADTGAEALDELEVLRAENAEVRAKAELRRVELLAAEATQARVLLAADARRATVEAQRGELLAALTDAWKLLPDCVSLEPCGYCIPCRVDAALAKARGGA